MEFVWRKRIEVGVPGVPAQIFLLLVLILSNPIRWMRGMVTGNEVAFVHSFPNFSSPRDSCFRDLRLSMAFYRRVDMLHTFSVITVPVSLCKSFGKGPTFAFSRRRCMNMAKEADDYSSVNKRGHPVSDDFEQPANAEEKIIEVRRFLYRLNSAASSGVNERNTGSKFQLEEQIRCEYERVKPGGLWNLVSREVALVVRGAPPPVELVSPPPQSMLEEDNEGRRRRVTCLGDELFSLKVLDSMSLDGEVGSSTMERAANVGAWDVSMAMALFFAARPDLLRGHTIELGSRGGGGEGVAGLGGIVSAIAAGFSEQIEKNKRSDDHKMLNRTASSTSGGCADDPIVTSEREGSTDHRNNAEVLADARLWPAGLESLTITDPNPAALNRCQRMMETSAQNVSVEEFNWYDPNGSDFFTAERLNAFQTVLAADCACHYPDVKPLALTIAALMAPRDAHMFEGDHRNKVGGDGMIFTFGPVQRDTMRHLQSELESRYRMDVSLRLLEMECLELDLIVMTDLGSIEEETFDKDVSSVWCPFESCVTTDFFYLVAQHNPEFRGGANSPTLRDNNDKDDGGYAPEPEVQFY